jgi:hypothetical protein
MWHALFDLFFFVSNLTTFCSLLRLCCLQVDQFGATNGHVLAFAITSFVVCGVLALYFALSVLLGGVCDKLCNRCRHLHPRSLPPGPPAPPGAGLPIKPQPQPATQKTFAGATAPSTAVELARPPEPSAPALDVSEPTNNPASAVASPNAGPPDPPPAVRPGVFIP